MPQYRELTTDCISSARAEIYSFPYSMTFGQSSHCLGAFLRGRQNLKLMALQAGRMVLLLKPVYTEKCPKHLPSVASYHSPAFTYQHYQFSCSFVQML